VNTPLSSDDEELRDKIRKLYGVKKSHYINFEPRLDQLMHLISEDRKARESEIRKEFAAELQRIGEEVIGPKSGHTDYCEHKKKYINQEDVVCSCHPVFWDDLQELQRTRLSQIVKEYGEEL
jgi:hypothetical protein